MKLRPAEFWALTFAEFREMVSGYARVQRQRINECIYTAWHTALFNRQQKLPALRDVLLDDDKGADLQEQTPEQALAFFRVLNAALGGSEVVV
jgi:hypothetical protein